MYKKKSYYEFMIYLCVWVVGEVDVKISIQIFRCMSLSLNS